MHLAVGVDDAARRIRAHASGAEVVRAGVDLVVDVVAGCRVAVGVARDVDPQPAKASLADLATDPAEGAQHAEAVVTRDAPVELDLRHPERILCARQGHAARRVGFLLAQDASGGDRLRGDALGGEQLDPAPRAGEELLDARIVGRERELERHLAGEESFALLQVRREEEHRLQGDVARLAFHVDGERPRGVRRDLRVADRQRHWAAGDVHVLHEVAADEVVLVPDAGRSLVVRGQQEPRDLEPSGRHHVGRGHRPERVAGERLDVDGADRARRRRRARAG